VGSLTDVKSDGYLALIARFATVLRGTSETPIFLRIRVGPSCREGLLSFNPEPAATATLRRRRWLRVKRCGEAHLSLPAEGTYWISLRSGYSGENFRVSSNLVPLLTPITM